MTNTAHDISRAAEKVRKLLALSTSCNASEAKSALLKAQKIMAEYKLEDLDIADAKTISREVVVIPLPFTYSARRDAWIETVADIIMGNMCCKGFRRNESRMTYALSVYGLKEDAELCAQAIQYAVKFVQHQNDLINRKMKAEGYSTKAISNARHNYGIGFAIGLHDAYVAAQEECTETALALVLPKEVEDYGKDTKPITRMQVNRKYNKAAERAGYEAGRHYQTPTAQLA